jgi:hypothetical protein
MCGADEFADTLASYQAELAISTACLGVRTARLLCLLLIFARCMAAIAEWFVPRCATSANGHTVADFVLITVR